MTTWTTPRTWADNDLVDAADLNEQLRDNLEWVKAVIDNGDSYECDEASSDYTTTSTNFTAVDSTNLRLTITTNGGDVLVGFCGSITTTSAGYRIFLDVKLDDDYLGNDDGLLAKSIASGLGDTPHPASFVYLVRDLETGEHTFELHWKVTAGTGKIHAGAGTTNADLHPQFWVQEV